MKRLTSILSLTIFAIALTSCGGSGGGTTPEPGPAPRPDPEPHPEIPIPNPDPSSKLLYNGISLPALWPPKNYSENVAKGMDPFYLKNKPSVIDITIGRQLFVDDFLISSTDLKRTWHRAEYHQSNPILKPEKDWELTDKDGAGSAAPFSDGVWYDEVDGKFKMWYMAVGQNVSGGYNATCYAESDDGISWTRPSLKIVPGTNIVSQLKERDANTVWIDKLEKNDSKRYKMFDVLKSGSDWHMHFMTSSDGIAWREQSESAKVMDRSTVFFNSFRGIWVWGLRHNVRVNANTLVRGRDYMENVDPALGTKNAMPDLSYFWFGSWPSDPRHEKYPSVIPGTYNLDAIAYESVLLGVFSVWSGPENDVCSRDNVIKRNQLLLGYSRDGWNWYREDFVPFCSVDDNTKAWNHGNIQSAVGSPLIVGDKLYFYMSGRRLNENNKEVVSTGLATLRRDGFASMSGNGSLTTEVLAFKGKFLYVNAAINGSLKVEVLDASGNVKQGFSANDCVSMKTDNTKCRITWKDNSTLESLNGEKIRLKFYLTDGDLYAFWISQFEDGRSYGYTAGGGPSLNKCGLDI